MVRSFLALRAQSLGYRPDKVLSLQISYLENRYRDGAPGRALVRRLTDEIAAVPGVTSVAFSSGIPLHDGWSRIFTIEGRPVRLQDMPFVNHVVIAPGYLQTLGIRLLQGRDFTEADYDFPRVLVVTESFVKKYWPHESAVGKRIRFGPPANNEPWHTVVGVVADNRHGKLKGDDRPNVYLPYSKNVTPGSLVVRTSVDPLQLAAAIKARIVAVDQDIAISHLLSLNQIIDRASWQDRFFTVLFGAFAALALSLAAVGLYAVLSYTVSLDTHEIGIRLALGASTSSVRGMVMRQGMTLAVLGLAEGLLAALGLTRLLKSQLYLISPLDPATYIAAPAVLLLVALIAVFLPARRATRVDPIIALRHE